VHSAGLRNSRIRGELGRQGNSAGGGSVANLGGLGLALGAIGGGKGAEGFAGDKGQGFGV
jgi:hypothetical protein